MAFASYLMPTSQQALGWERVGRAGFPVWGERVRGEGCPPSLMSGGYRFLGKFRWHPSCLPGARHGVFSRHLRQAGAGKGDSDEESASQRTSKQSIAICRLWFPDESLKNREIGDNLIDLGKLNVYSFWSWHKKYEMRPALCILTFCTLWEFFGGTNVPWTLKIPYSCTCT